jgi:hypothetical protein
MTPAAAPKSCRGPLLWGAACTALVFVTAIPNIMMLAGHRQEPLTGWASLAANWAGLAILAFVPVYVAVLIVSLILRKRGMDRLAYRISCVPFVLFGVIVLGMAVSLLA